MCLTRAVIHRWLIPLILDDRGNRSLFPHGVGLCISTRIHLSWDPLQQLLKEAGIYSSRRWRHREPDAAIDDFGISCGRVIIPEHTSVRRDSKPTFTEHYKSTQHRDSIGVEVEQLTVQKAHDGY
jgi:hypothetical protein